MASRIKGFGVTGFSATSTSIAPSTSAGVRGDIHVAALTVFNQAATITPPSTQWTQIGSQHNAAAQYQMSYWWWYDDATTTSFTWAWSGAAVNRGVWHEVYRGVDDSNPIQTSLFNQGTSATAASNGTVFNAEGAGFLFMGNDNGFTAGSTPAGWTLQNNTIDQAAYTLEAQAVAKDTAITITVSGGSSDWVCDMIALRNQRPSFGPTRSPIGV